MSRSFKFFLALFLICASSLVQAQATFTKGEIIKKSYQYTNEASIPVLIKSEEGFQILSSSILSPKKIIQVSLNKDMNFVSESSIKLPKGQSAHRIIALDGKIFIVTRNSDDTGPFSIYSYDPKSATLGEVVLSLDVDDYNGKLPLKVETLNAKFDDAVAIVVGNNTTDDDNYYYKVFMCSRQANEVLWSHRIIRPVIGKDDPKGYVTIDNMYFNDKNTFVIKYYRKYLKEEKYEIITEMYHFDGKEMSKVWEMPMNFNEIVSNYSSSPLVYVSEAGNIEMRVLNCETSDGQLALLKLNEDGEEISRVELSSKMGSVENVRRVGVGNLSIPVNDNFDNGTFSFLAMEALESAEKTEDDLRTYYKYYFITVELLDGAIVHDNVVDAGYIKSVSHIVDGRIILSSSLDYIADGKVYRTDQKDVFDRFIRVAKYTEPGWTYHYVIDDEVYSLHSEYATGNMTSQLVQWNFED